MSGPGAIQKWPDALPSRPSSRGDDYGYVRLLIARFCPVTLPRQARKYFRAVPDMERALTAYMLRVELGWQVAEVSAELHFWREGIRKGVAAVEELRDVLPFIDKIATKLKEYRRGLL